MCTYFLYYCEGDALHGTVTVPFTYFPFGPLFPCTYLYCGSNKVVKIKLSGIRQVKRHISGTVHIGTMHYGPPTTSTLKF